MVKHIKIRTYRKIIHKIQEDGMNLESRKKRRKNKGRENIGNICIGIRATTTAVLYSRH